LPKATKTSFRTDYPLGVKLEDKNHFFCTYEEHMKWQITRHLSNNLKPEMTLDKLQLIATAAVGATFKVIWLRWWNSSSMTWDAKHFLPRPVFDKELEYWLNKASFYVGMSFRIIKASIILAF
jgi:hypothetical protein